MSVETAPVAKVWWMSLATDINVMPHVKRFPNPVPWEEKAAIELRETPERRRAALEKFQRKLEEITEFKPYMEQQFLLGFLRTRKFDVDSAVKAYKKFFKMRTYNPAKYFPMGQGTLELHRHYSFGSLTALSRRNPIDNTMVLILRVGEWTPESGFDLSDLFTPVAVVLLAYGMDDATQALVEVVQGAFPVRFKGFHILENSIVFNYLYLMTKPFLSRKIKKRILVHGNDVRRLHEHICPSILPEEYDGLDGPFRWRHFVEPLDEIHDKVVDFSHHGYNVL
ncbi:alpha-tocopherol transfer protein-like isoform X3 [Varroa destructor]|uniref:CRAL-TRIO domain-containing protein n=1 Tax=Varroa destructor TaxID=109461 RepID=A0A7M7K248_VARDE|nr:alpha-tocopherol transfer protein-like isoform X3 [Varroa destructor]